MLWVHPWAQATEQSWIRFGLMWNKTSNIWTQHMSYFRTQHNIRHRLYWSWPWSCLTAVSFKRSGHFHTTNLRSRVDEHLNITLLLINSLPRYIPMCGREPCRAQGYFHCNLFINLKKGAKWRFPAELLYRRKQTSQTQPWETDWLPLKLNIKNHSSLTHKNPTPVIISVDNRVKAVKDAVSSNTLLITHELNKDGPRASCSAC